MPRPFEHVFESVGYSERLVRLLVVLVDAVEVVRPGGLHGGVTGVVYAELAAVRGADLEGVRGVLVLETLHGRVGVPVLVGEEPGDGHGAAARVPDVAAGAAGHQPRVGRSSRT